MKSPAVPRGGDRPAVVNPPAAAPPRSGSSALRPELRAIVDQVRPLARSLPARQLLLLVEDLADYLAASAELHEAQHALGVARERRDWQAAKLLQGQVEQLTQRVDERERVLRGEPEGELAAETEGRG